MKIFTTGLALALLSAPVFAQNFNTEEDREARREKQVLEGQSLSPFTGGAPVGTTINDVINENHTIGAVARASNYTNGVPVTYGQTTTVITTPSYGYHAYSAYPVPYPYPAYGYPAPYPYPAYGYPAPYPYPSNTITTAPIGAPYNVWPRPATVTSISMGTTYYYNGTPYPVPNYPHYYNHPGYGYSYKQSNNASITFGNKNFRVKVGNSSTKVR
jgi:hypothetical protein